MDSNAHLQKHVVDLEPDREEDVDCEGATKPLVRPIVQWLGLGELRNEDCRPNPPSALQCDDRPKGEARS